MESRRFKSRAFRSEKKGEEKKKRKEGREREREREGKERKRKRRKAARRNPLEGNGRGYLSSKRDGRGGGEGTRAGALTTSRRAHCIPRIPRRLRAALSWADRPSARGSNTIDRSHFAGDPARFRSVPLRSTPLRSARARWFASFVRPARTMDSLDRA